MQPISKNNYRKGNKKVRSTEKTKDMSIANNYLSGDLNLKCEYGADTIRN